MSMGLLGLGETLSERPNMDKEEGDMLSNSQVTRLQDTMSQDSALVTQDLALVTQDPALIVQDPARH